MYGDLVQDICNKSNLSKYQTLYMNSGIFTPNLNWLGDCIIEAAKKEAKNEASGPCRKEKQHNSRLTTLLCWACACNACALQLVLTQDTVPILFLSQITKEPKPKWKLFAEQVRPTHWFLPTVSPWIRSSQCMCRIIPQRLFSMASEILHSPIETFNKIKYVPHKHHWLLLVSTHLKKYACQIGNLPQFSG